MDRDFATSLISMPAMFLPADSISISEAGHCRVLYIIFSASIRYRISIRPGRETATSGLLDRHALLVSGGGSGAATAGL